jgi:hypothetical protein
MKVKFALCAQSASVDRTSNRISIFNVIDHLAAATLPIFLPTVTFVSVLECEKEEAVSFKGSFDVVLNNNQIIHSEVPINFTNNRLARVTLTVNTIPLREDGILSFRLTIPDLITADASFRVVNLSQEKRAQQPELPLGNGD